MIMIHTIKYQNPKTPANPRMPMVKDMEKILVDVYWGPNGKPVKEAE